MNNNIVKDKIIKYAWGPLYCILEDCNRENCHNCFPVLGCTKHKKCIEQGQFIEFSQYMLNKSKYDANQKMDKNKKPKIKN